MANPYIPNYTPPTPQTFQAQQFFPQPQGNVYLINNSLEVANVPVGAGMSVAICMSEGILYVKAMQNGNPIFQTYRMTPYEGKNQTPASATPQTEIPPHTCQTAPVLEKVLKRLDSIESQLAQKETKGGKSNGEF